MPASPFESPRAALTLADQAGILARERVLGLAEMMNFPAVIAGDPASSRSSRWPRASASTATRRACAAPTLDAYLATGIATDHESTVLEEALEKRRKGAWVLLREASNARNLRDAAAARARVRA